ncbi:MAG: transposase [Candidatus Brocadiaceae bacterium]|nr:transposase [Candidatus Brocadiaceae bacterium]
MDVIVERGCGLDIHKETVVACMEGRGIKKEIRTYSTFTNDLVKLKEWLKGNGITHVAMESTGIYWKPVYNILEEDFEVVLVDARHIKHVPSGKTDVCDSEWLCKLLRNGLVKDSFVPERDMRELRDLTRYRKKLVQAISSEKNRVQKILEDANIKLSSVVSDTFGVSGSETREALIAVGHKILIACYHILKQRVPYRELGRDSLDERRKDKITKSYVKRLTSLGYQVTLAEVA